jgi:FkbM family methyltransferase
MLGRLKQLVMKCLPARVAGRLRSWRVRQLIGTYSPRVVRHTFGSGPLSVYLSDPLAQGWYDRDWAELPEIAWLRRTRLKPGARVFDLGAHQGVVAMMLGREVGPTGRVVAVEPNPHNAEAASRNLQLNAMDTVTVVRAAIADQCGQLTFNEGLNGQLDDGSGAGGRITVDALTIDELANRYGTPDVLFIDVEGCECRALTGSSSVLRGRPDLFVEVHVGCGLEKFGGSVAEVCAFFPQEHYQLFGRAEQDTDFRPLTPDDPLTKDRFFLLALAKRG